LGLLINISSLFCRHLISPSSRCPESPMLHLLHVDTSARVQHSFSRQLTHHFITAWRQHQPGGQITYRDIGSQPIPHIDEQWVMAYESAAQSPVPALALSETLINELFAADGYVFGIPMYNLTIPSTLKAYLDQVVRRDRLFQIESHQPQGLLVGKKLLIITTRKFNYRPGSGRENRDFLEPYLREIWGIIGVDDITFVHVDQLEDNADQSLTAATATLNALASQWTAPSRC
jgi:FMN-dependent NADH-azoreductase